MSFIAKEEAAAGGGSGAGGGSVASTGSVAVSMVDQILDDKGIQIGSDDPLNSQQQANVAAASAEAIDAAIDEVEPSRLWQEIVALIKVYGGWAGAALALSINAYLAVSTNNIQGLIAALPGMLKSILSNPNIPGYVAGAAANSVKATAAIVFLRAVISYLSFDKNPATIGSDIDAFNNAFIQKMIELNPNIQADGIDQRHLDVLRQNQLKLTTVDVTRKAKIIVDTVLTPSAWAKTKETIGRLCEVPFTYLREARTVLATYAIGAVGNLQEYIANRDDLLSIASDSTDSHNSLWEKLLQEGAAPPLLGEPVAGGGPAEKQVQLLEGAKVLQVVLPQEEGVVEETKKAINHEIGNVLAVGGAGGGAIPETVFFRKPDSASQDTVNSDITDSQSGADDARRNARLKEQKMRREEQFNVRRGISEPAHGSDRMGGFTVTNVLEAPLQGPEGMIQDKAVDHFSQPGGKKRNSKRKTKKAKRTKKRSKKSSKRKTRR